MKPRDRLLAWIVTGPPGHLWSAVVDIGVLLKRHVSARLRGRVRPGR